MPARRGEGQGWGVDRGQVIQSLVDLAAWGRDEEAQARSWEMPKWAVTVTWVRDDGT